MATENISSARSFERQAWRPNPPNLPPKNENPRPSRDTIKYDFELTTCRKRAVVQRDGRLEGDYRQWK